MDNWITPNYNFKKHTRHDSPWWQPIKNSLSQSILLRLELLTSTSVHFLVDWTNIDS